MTVKFTDLSAAAQTAYAGLSQATRQAELARSIADAPGGFAGKTIGARVYWYYQTKSPDGVSQQFYVGPDDEPTRALIAQHRDPTARAARQHLARLCAAAMALGCYGVIPKHARVLARLADHGLFRAGGVLVGTHAFLAYQNHFGVRWRAGDTTADPGFAHPGRNISLALPSNVRVDSPGAIESLKMGFIPVNEGTRYVKADEQDFDLDFLTTRHRGGDAPVALARLGLKLQPLRFMEYPLEATLPLVLPASAGPILVNVPRPERYALAKLLVHVERSRSNPSKARKDLEQAASLIDLLTRTDPTALHEAWDNLVSRGPSWLEQARSGVQALARHHHDIAGVLDDCSDPSGPTPEAGRSQRRRLR